MKLIVCLMTCVLLLGIAASTGDALAYRWNVKTSEHFILYYQNAPADAVDRISEGSERYYGSITKELGFTRFGDFWTWEKRAKIYLYDNQKDYMIATNRGDWSAAHVNIVTRDMYAYLDMENFLDTILPHELGHIIFREFIGFKRKLPLWLDEGIVSFVEKKNKEDRLLVAKAVSRTTYFQSLQELTDVKINLQIIPEIFYSEAASIIEFLVAVYGIDKFVQLCQGLRDLRADQGWFVAFEDTYKFRDINDMSKKWVEFLSH